GQRLVPVLPDLVRRRAEQDIDDVRRAEPLTGAVDRRQELARGLRAVPRRGRVRAVVAVAASLGRRLAEILEQGTAPARRDLAPAEQGLELLPLAPLVLLVRGGALDDLPDLHDVLQAVHHPRVGRLAVPYGTARFLIVRLDALRQI